MFIVILSYKESFDNKVMEILEQEDIHSYTKWPKVLDKSAEGRAKLGTHIFPGFNSAVLFTIEVEKKQSLFNRLREYNQQYKYDKIKGFCWKLDEFILE